MFPVSQNERLQWDDVKGGVRYFFISITGENELKFYDLMDKYRSKKTSGDNTTNRFSAIDELIDFLVIGWESIGEKAVPPFKKPSSFFRIDQKNRLCEKAYELNNLSEEDEKN